MGLPQTLLTDLQLTSPLFQLIFDRRLRSDYAALAAIAAFFTIELAPAAAFIEL
jgi:hypothetical protein